ncbi:hypothetical protein BU24DRAFT_228538 [Aaosphaeria arxii CBS 175.79]|uniref:Uncharacterized protein n=1 Tax=Aaosphaeria arxii CBS 175.79 TaxID=1450172 RepID=A0A6A5XQE8_9PLEO|nr:uncharacterized protein BU24DRAFT_228538 [Aaosphaeria arxii CBS 175.79]KAF2015126.1 hypothetical protein BU24DRAFT_228538 [Aaosphaeria arxii CBS 175.79]
MQYTPFGGRSALRGKVDLKGFNDSEISRIALFRRAAPPPSISPLSPLPLTPTLRFLAACCIVYAAIAYVTIAWHCRSDWTSYSKMQMGCVRLSTAACSAPIPCQMRFEICKCPQNYMH